MSDQLFDDAELDDFLERVQQDRLFFLAEFYAVQAGVKNGQLPGSAAGLELINALVKHWSDNGPPSGAWKVLAEQLGPCIPVPLRYLSALAEGWDRHVLEGGDLPDNLKLKEASKQGSHWREAIRRGRERFVLAVLFELKFTEWQNAGEAFSRAKAVDQLVVWLRDIDYWSRRGLTEPDPAANEIELAIKEFGPNAHRVAKILNQ